MRPIFPPAGEPGDAAGRRQRITYPLPLGWDPPNSRDGVVDPEVLDVDRHLGSESVRDLAKGRPSRSSRRPG